MWASVILLQRGVMLLHKWENMGPYDVVTVSDACKCAVQNHKSCSAMGWDSTSYHDTTSAERTPLNHTTVMETFTNTTVYSRTSVAAVEMKPGFIREKNTCPVLLREVYVSSTPGETCYTMTLLENRTYAWTSWPYASFMQSITYRSGTNPPKTRNTSSCQSSSSESITEINHPDVRILTIRRYAWTSWPRPVSDSPKLLIPSPQGGYSISMDGWMDILFIDAQP